MGRLPKDWIGCPDRVDLVNDRFLVFKTPLSEKFNLPSSIAFPLRKVFDEANRRYRRQIGVWIDLTNTSRYYDYRNITSNGIEYIKINCEGHGCVPNDNTIQRFNFICRSFFNSWGNQGQVIGYCKIPVHCTHGFNRTGYLICSFLILELNLHVQNALYEFTRFRSPGIYREEYIKTLVNRYTNPGEVYYYPVTPLPSWLIRNPQFDASSPNLVQIPGSSIQMFTTQTTEDNDTRIPLNKETNITIKPGEQQDTQNQPGQPIKLTIKLEEPSNDVTIESEEPIKDIAFKLKEPSKDVKIESEEPSKDIKIKLERRGTKGSMPSSSTDKSRETMKKKRKSRKKKSRNI